MTDRVGTLLIAVTEYPHHISDVNPPMSSTQPAKDQLSDSGGPIRTSESEEMFLITVARAIESGHASPVPVPYVAETLSESRVAANEMAKKLVARGLVEYEPYRGVTLTGDGTAVANRVLRRRRLWAFFLAEHLGLSPSDADTAACELEHVTPSDVEKRLAEYLGEPRVDPEGNPIPPGDDASPDVPDEKIGDLDAGSRARVIGLAGEPAARSFLKDAGITDGLEVEVLARGPNGALLVATPEGQLHLSPVLAEGVIVHRLAG